MFSYIAAIEPWQIEPNRANRSTKLAGPGSSGHRDRVKLLRAAHMCAALSAWPDSAMPAAFHCNRRLSLRRLRTRLAGVGNFMAGNHPLCHSHFQKRACLGLRSKIRERSLRHFVIRLLLGFLRGRGRMVQARSLASISIARRCSYPASASSALSNPPRDSRA